LMFFFFLREQSFLRTHVHTRPSRNCFVLLPFATQLSPASPICFLVVSSHDSDGLTLL